MQYLKGYCTMDQRNWLKMKRIPQSMSYAVKIRTLERSCQKLEAGWIIHFSPMSLHRRLKLYGKILRFRKHIPGVMSFKFQTVPIISWKTCKDCLTRIIFQLSLQVYLILQEDVLYARVRTTGVVEIQFSPVGENKRSGEVYRLFDVGGQRNERRKWIHLFEGVTAVIFCAAISEYDQTLFEDENKNRMMETKELFEWVLKQPCFEKTSFMLFLNKFDLFEKKVLKVPLNVCEWFKDYQPVSTGKQEIEHAYEFVKKKFEEFYFQSTTPDRVDRVFKIYRTTALDQKLVKKTFKLVDETLRRRNLFEAGLL
ncbi:guanine nucleotide-binding protein alpha-1 subunit isoform X2 [Hevea brasiliensis]|uniref:guanine nucleotide-binding protein alpha-1 subunit isoform X2 n=1 Tax=Hevea brasiliensis TaxID=3981 RepID=UPI0025D0D34E|nr:guanine nucleotide-binding protein alpha-1 subunit isoform X2 [Hevea brasiliensis]